jgi:hypothetical protein
MIELNRDAEVIVGEEVVLASLGRKLIHAPRPAEPRVGLERQDRVFDQQRCISGSIAADGFVVPVGPARAAGGAITRA